MLNLQPRESSSGISMHALQLAQLLAKRLAACALRSAAPLLAPLLLLLLRRCCLCSSSFGDSRAHTIFVRSVCTLLHHNNNSIALVVCRVRDCLCAR